MQKDKQVFDIIHKELERQRHGIELIASENFTSLQVIQAMGTVLTNKYAEGYPGKRYYGGCEFVDEAEQLAIDRLKQIFDCEYANVQPHSGAQANAALMLAILQPGDKILGLDLSMGGHLTHGSLVFMFGLIHGLGFASSLNEIGLPRNKFATSILSFNLGVELGQVTIILLMFALIISRFGNKEWYRRRIVYPLSIIIAITAAFWTLERVINI
jgi:hypothetical protein